MDIANDELRRQLRESQADHEATQPVFAEALATAFDPDRAEAHAPIPEPDKARLLGLSDRRGFLRIGGLTVATSALLVACVNPDKEKVQLAQTGTLPATTTTKVAPNPGSAEVDATLVLTALSIERLAIDTYAAALQENLLQAPLLQDVAKYFQSQHSDHAGLLASTAKKMGQNPDAVTANPYLNTEVVQPALKTITGEKDQKEAAQTDTLKLALELEDAAAQTYTMAGGVLTTPELRQAIMSIGGIEARHYSVLAAVLGQPMVPFAFGHTNGAAPEDSYIKPNGTVPGGTTSGTAKATPGTLAK